MDRIKSLLLNLDNFSQFEEKVIDSLSQKSLVKKYHQEEILFFDREIVEEIYIIASGRVKISKFTPGGKEKIIHILTAGEIINEITLDGKSSSVTAEVIEEGEIISIKMDSLQQIMKDDFALTLHILNSANLKLRQAYRQIRNLGLKKSGARIASRLWKLARDYGKDSQEGIEIDLNLSQRELALMIGISRETVSRFLSKLSNEEVIEVGKNKITILDLEELSNWT
ncbi:Crp/Fnr family transcriptional regulator [Halanaerocella petrolearia]